MLSTVNTKHFDLFEFCINKIQNYNFLLSKGSLNPIDYAFILIEMEEYKVYDV